jgi:hypothetical protein
VYFEREIAALVFTLSDRTIPLMATDQEGHQNSADTQYFNVPVDFIFDLDF